VLQKLLYLFVDDVFLGEASNGSEWACPEIFNNVVADRAGEKFVTKAISCWMASSN
jgi:hypothetical protein